MIFKAFLILLIIQTSLGYQTFVQLMSKYKTKDFVFDLDNSFAFSRNGNSTIRRSTVAQIAFFSLFRYFICNN
jgi:hypothetical protein